MLIGSGFCELMINESFFENRKYFGNSLQTHNFIKSVKFIKLLTKMKQNFPDWSQTKQIERTVNLKKSFHSFGGNKVEIAGKNARLKKNEYFQKLIKGEHLSVQFFSDKKETKILSVCNQFFKNENKKPFIIKGLVTKKTDYSLMDKLLKICLELTNLLKLRGLCNIDIILEDLTQKIYIIELNARPGLSINILGRIINNLFDKNFAFNPTSQNKFFATQIIYSSKNISIEKKNFEYIKKLKEKKYISELPTIGQKIKKNAPVCLIHLTSRKIHKLRENLEKMSYKILNNLN